MSEGIPVTATEERLRSQLMQIPEWELADTASVGLAQVLVALPEERYEGPREGAGGALRLHAQKVIGVRVFRTIRAAMMVLSIGYEPEAGALDRILVELMAHRATIEADETGEEALQWLDGKRGAGIAAKVNAMSPGDLYRNLCHDAHGDPRAIWRLIDPESNSIILAPQRRMDPARASLLLYAGVACDQVGVIAPLASMRVGGHDDLVAKVRDAWANLADAGDPDGPPDGNVQSV